MLDSWHPFPGFYFTKGNSVRNKQEEKAHGCYHCRLTTVQTQQEQAEMESNPYTDPYRAWCGKERLGPFRRHSNRMSARQLGFTSWWWPQCFSAGSWTKSKTDKRVFHSKKPQNPEATDKSFWLTVSPERNWETKFGKIYARAAPVPFEQFLH